MSTKGGEQGLNLIVKIDLEIKEAGLYWFDVLLERGKSTRAFHVIPKSQPQTESSTPASNHQA